MVMDINQQRRGRQAKPLGWVRYINVCISLHVYSFIYQDTGGVRRLRVPFFFSTPMGVF